ncbi:MAG: hypothetical protein ACI3ZK_07295 [Candidatus Cryptobacteroides sp.]
MANTVTFRIKIEGEKELKNVTVDAKELGAAFSSVQAEVKNLKGEMVSFASKVQILEGAFNAIGQLQSILSGVSSAYAAQETAETRLAQAMRNTMGASEEEIQSIKELAATQQKHGIVGDEVQLAAAQELATYLEFSDSLKTIIPVLNDMIAQQLGLGASAESATQIATMLGKVMNGQTEALSRYGYKFDDAQKQILQYGEESERAAVLADVVSEAVGGMNEAMARTSSGRMQQAANTIGDIKEQIGKAVQGAMPFISALAEIAMAGTGILRLAAAFQALGAKQLFAKVQTLALTAAQRTQAIAARILGVSQMTAATATGVLRAQIIALQAAMTFGLAAAIQVVITLLSKLFSSSEKASDGIEEVNKAQDAYRKAGADARAEIASDIVALEDLIKSKGREGETVAELNRKYGEAFGTYSSATEWYDILTTKSKDYCQQLAYEALALEYKEELAAALKRQEEATTHANNVIDDGYWGKGTYRDGYGVERQGDNVWHHGKKWTAAQNEMQAANRAVEELTGKMTSAMQKAKELADSLRDSGSVAVTSWKDMNLADLEKAIRDQKSLVESLAGGSDSDTARQAASELKQMEARAKALKAAYGLDTSFGTNKDKYDGSSLIEGASSYKELGNNIKYYQNKLEEANAADIEAIQLYSQKIAELQEQQAAIKAAADAAGIPVELNSLEDINKAITFQQALRRQAKAQDIAGIDEEIERLNILKMVFETGFDPSDEKAVITTYAQLDAAIQYCNESLKDAAEGDRKAIQIRINSLEELRKKWDETAAELKAPGKIGTLDTMEKLDEAISYYQAKQKTATADEIAGIQETILALQAKRKMLENVATLPEMQLELAGLEGLSGKQLKLELDLIGLDGIKEKIRSLQKMLSDTKNPLDSTQRAQVEALIASYSSYQKVLQQSNVTFAAGWSNIKGIGNSVKDLTEILKSDGDAWDKVSGIIDNTLALYESFSSIIEIVKMLTTVTNAHTVAKQVEGAAELTEAGQAAAAGAANIATNTAVTASENLRTTAQVGSAVSGVMAAHSSIPFVGWALGLAAAGSIVAMMLSLPKFADGGIAYGPTLGLFGEYAGASNNPEVVAPLDRLKALIGTDTGALSNVQFRIRGRDLVGIMEKEGRISLRVF